MPPIPLPRADGYTTTTDVPLYWAKYGPEDAPQLLVLHGGPGAHHDYLLPQMLDLAHDHELVFYDQRGGGRSKVEGRDPITWRTHVDDLARVATELARGALSLVGYSWGGLLAMLHQIEHAGDAAQRAARLVLIDPAPATRQYRARFEAEFARRQASPPIAALREELGTSRLREQDPEQHRQRAFELSVAGYFADPGAARDLTPFRVMGRVQQSVWQSLGDFDVTDGLARLTPPPPTLVLHGREDPIPLESSEEAARVLDARLVVIDRSGHVPYVEQPSVLFPAIREFLNETAHLVRG